MDVLFWALVAFYPDNKLFSSRRGNVAANKTNGIFRISFRGGRRFKTGIEIYRGILNNTVKNCKQYWLLVTRRTPGLGGIKNLSSEAEEVEEWICVIGEIIT